MTNLHKSSKSVLRSTTKVNKTYKTEIPINKQEANISIRNLNFL